MAFEVKMLMEDGPPPSTNATSTAVPTNTSQNEENPPSPLVTEADEDEDGGPSSVEVGVLYHKAVLQYKFEPDFI